MKTAKFIRLKRQILPLCFLFAFNISFADIENDAKKEIEEGENIINIAEEELKKSEKECYEKFLVNHCLETAQKKYKEEIKRGKNLKQKGNRTLREIKKAKNEEKIREQNAKIQKHKQKLIEKEQQSTVNPK